MKFSKSLISTYREAPAEAEVISHNLLIRAGMIRKVAAGVFELLPLGLKSLRRVENIIRTELDKAGCQEVLLPHLVPAELWQKSGRWAKYGKELLRIKDRHEREYCFGPTHEETMCDLVGHMLTSYKSFPQHIYQIQTKFRDEIRPRFGLMRGREFLMKDSYSFHTSEEDLDREYKLMYATYQNIFKRCGLESRVVDADSGAIGGSSSHEFMVMAETGEDLIAVCEACEYAANIEKAMRDYDVSGVSLTAESFSEVHTPDQKSIKDVSEFLKIKSDQMIKTLVYKADDEFVILCLAGDREASEVKLDRILQVEELRLASDAEILELTGVPVGFLGPVGLQKIIDQKNPQAKYRFFYDQSLRLIGAAATGANKSDYHLVHVNLERDLGLKINGSDQFDDFSVVLAQDPCPQCHTGDLKLIRGIEVGHIFKLGQRYSIPMKVNYLDQNGKDQSCIMGTYGIGVGRTMAASIEQNHDDKGIVWPRALAPFDVHLIQLDISDELNQAAQSIYDGLHDKGVTVLWDERKERAGVKFNDADLIGLPLQIVVGNRGLKSGQFEYKIRKTGAKGDLSIDQAVAQALQILEGL